MKNMPSLRNCHSQVEPKETWWLNTMCQLGWVLEQKKLKPTQANLSKMWTLVNNIVSILDINCDNVPSVMTFTIRANWVLGMCKLSILSSQYFFFRKSKPIIGNYLTVQWLGLHASTAGGTGLIPDQGTKIPHAMRCGQKKKFNLI